MTTRFAEITMAVLMGIVSLAIIMKIWTPWDEGGLVVTWIPGRGPGAGMWPLWLACGMLVSCMWTIVRWFRRSTEESRSSAPFVGETEVRIIVITIFALFMLMLISQFAGMYVGIIAFLFFYLRFLGGHGWNLTITLTIMTPLFLFFFFEWLLKIPLPHGWSEPVLIAIGAYDLIYGQGGPGWALLVFPVGVGVSLLIAYLGNRDRTSG